MKYTTLNKYSERGRLIKACDKLHFEILKKRRGAQCEICGKTGSVGRFHILRTASHPRLRYVDDNVILACWLPCHNAWHAYGPNDPKNRRTLERIKELRGEDYEQKLLDRERFTGKMDKLYLICLRETMRKELSALRD